MANLFRFENRIDGYEDTPGCAGTKHCADGLELFGQIDGDALVALDTQGPKTRCNLVDQLVYRPIAQGVLPEEQRRCIRCTLCTVVNKLVEQKGHELAAISSKARL